MKLPISKKFKFFLIGILVIGISSGIRVANAQIPSPAPIPAPAPIPCSDPGKDPEFHSLRPYQASPCVAKMAETAKFCGNTLTLQDQVDVTYQPGVDNCSQPSGGKVICNYVIPRSEKITINLSNAKLPIMGNTENVPNSQTPTDDSPTLNDKEKVNGYVSWYLNGVMNRAEDGSSENNSYNVVNLSGPLNKLLPGVISDAQRIKSINNAKVINHNQIVVCTDHDPGFWGSILDVFKLGKYTAKPCYANNGSPASDETRLTEWNGMLSVGNLMLNESIKFAVQGLRLIYPFAPTGLIEESIGRHWNSRLPPLPWENDPYANSTRQMTGTEYQKYYNEWQGKTCVIIPIIDYLVCFNNILIPSKYADMYSYIPLSSTEDIKGNIEIDSVSVGGPGITNVTFTSQSSTLYFPHLVESDQLGSTLQDTYISKDQQKDQKTGPDTAVAPPSSCTTVDVRSNAGDKLFATSLSGTLGYTASFSCTFDTPTPTQPYCSGTCFPNQHECIYAGGKVGEGSCINKKFCCNLPNQVPKPIPTPQPPQTCSKTVSVALSTSSNTPKIDDIWSRLVGGPTAVVKRMFPKLGTQIGTLKDIPGSTSIDYSGSTQGSAELNFPHVGGISEYFLKGIQTMLRPKGYGEPISFGPTTGDNKSSKVDCDQSAPDIVLPKTVSKEELHQIAIRWESQEGDHVLECYNDVARKSLAAGISPAFTFLMWINESGGSNYNISNQDWGINSSQITGLTAQLERFLQLPSAYKNNYPQCFGKIKTDTEVYFDLFAVGLQGGQCVPGAGYKYMKLLNDGWGVFTTCPMTSYPFGSSCY